MTETQAAEHTVTVRQTDDGGWQRTCTCGHESTVLRRLPEGWASRPCPYDPTVRALRTLQFSRGGLFDGRPADGWQVHLVRATASGTPGPTLCGIDRFAPDTPGWSVGGGVSGPDIKHVPCSGCAQAARTQFPGLPIEGSVGAKEMREALDA